ncbi:MAG: OmpW family outer membrane protein [Rubrivivax sp.]|nr:OmpW family outer membrane protein [Rubrivivax sp.]
MKTRIGLTALALAALTPLAQAQDSGNWIVRGRAVHLDSANTNSGDLRAALTSLGSREASINDRWLPEVDITYFYTPNIAVELVLTYPQKQKLSITNVGEIGTFKHLPPILSLQYHFTDLGSFRPYVGAGLNYTNISDVKWGSTAQSLGLNLKRNSYGLSLQAGLDVPMGGGWLFNADVKKVQIKTDVSSFGTKIGTFKIDPTLISLGVGKRF